MITKATSIRTQTNEQNKAEIVLTTDQSRLDISELKEIIKNGKELSAEIKQYRKKRSLDSNAYAWVLMNEIANVLRTSKDEVYLKMLKLYGQSSVISVIDKAADTFRKSVKYCEDMGEADMGDKHFIHIRVFMGSSEFDTRQMSIFIDGIVSEAKELGVNTLTPAEIALLKQDWGR